MTLVFVDGFDHLDGTAAYATKWTQAYNMVNGDFASNTGRRGTGGVFTGNNASTCLYKDITGTSQIYLGAAVKPTTNQTGNIIFELLNTNSAHISLHYNGGSGLKVYRGTSGGTLLGTGSINVTTGTWYYIELYVKIDDTAGHIHLKIDGVTDINTTGLDTKEGSTTTINRLALGSWQSFNATRSCYYDDLYVCDSTGSTNNDFLGDSIVDTIYPTGAGNTTQWTPSTGSTNWSLVDEARSTTSNTDYVSSSTNGHRDLYTFGDITTRADPDVYAVAVNLFAQKQYSYNTDQVAASIRYNSVDEDKTPVALTNSVGVKQFIVEADPSAAAWTQTSVNAAEFGFEEHV